ncbi:MAG: putative CDP-diacylglycerol--serine O-phosphatidyltransferase, partial [Planctomycetota bacterium]
MNTPTDITKRRRFRLRRRMERGRAMPALAVIPALMTLGNLICGFAAIHYAAMPVATTEIFGWNTLTVACCLLFLGMFLDALDGSVARLTRSTSDLGAQLDSLADMV